jgi:mannitol/fructose-specific phosphotransferase system IIA component (Ntr-type)
MWYFLFTRKHVKQKSAFVHMVEKLTNRELVKDRTVLEGELIDILRERDEVKEDRFDSIIRQAEVIDMDRTVTLREFFALVAETIGRRWGIDPNHVAEKLNQREEQSSTLLYPGVAVPHAIPHIVVDGKGVFDIVLVRNKFGIIWDEGEEGPGEEKSKDVVYTAFCLIGSKDERNFHLKALMSIAQVLQDPEFHKAWHKARNADELRSVILVSKRRRS